MFYEISGKAEISDNTMQISLSTSKGTAAIAIINQATANTTIKNNEINSFIFSASDYAGILIGDN